MKCKIPSVGPTAEELRSRTEVHVDDPTSSSRGRFLNATIRAFSKTQAICQKCQKQKQKSTHTHVQKKECLHPTIHWNIAPGGCKIFPAINIFSFWHFFQFFFPFPISIFNFSFFFQTKGLTWRAKWFAGFLCSSTYYSFDQRLAWQSDSWPVSLTRARYQSDEVATCTTADRVILYWSVRGNSLFLSLDGEGSQRTSCLEPGKCFHLKQTSEAWQPSVHPSIHPSICPFWHFAAGNVYQRKRLHYFPDLNSNMVKFGVNLVSAMSSGSQNLPPAISVLHLLIPLYSNGYSFFLCVGLLY